MKHETDGETILRPALLKYVDAKAGTLTILACGIIDWLQTWNWKKTVAQHIKKLERNKSTIPPDRYGARFKDVFASNKKKMVDNGHVVEH